MSNYLMDPCVSIKILRKFKFFNKILKRKVSSKMRLKNKILI